jgi:hypothetical protein
VKEIIFGGQVRNVIMYHFFFPPIHLPQEMERSKLEWLACHSNYPQASSWYTGINDSEERDYLKMLF